MLTNIINNRKPVKLLYISALFCFISINSKNTEVYCQNNDLIYPGITQAQANPAKNKWRVLPIRSREEYEHGLIGGEAEQHLHGIARSLSNPDMIYLSHDVGGAWRSIDAGNTWQKTLDKGLFVNKGLSIEVDPADPSTVLFMVSNSWDWPAKDFQGIYRSTDKGDNWELVLQTNTNYDPGKHRLYTHNIAYDSTSIKSKKAMRWYAAIPENGIFLSNDGGISWTKRPVENLKGHSIIYSILPHPSDRHTVYMASDKGFFISKAQGKNLQQSGKLPEGHVSSIAVNPKAPSMIYVTIKDKGLYLSKDGGVSFSLMKKFDAAKVFINPGFPEIIYLVGLNSSTTTSRDGGITWGKEAKTIPAPGLGRDGSWKSKIAGQLTGIAPNPQDRNEAVAYSRATIWKTTDCGKTFKDSSTLFTGYAWSWCNGGAAFDQFDKKRFAFFNCDVGMTITHNGGKYFEGRNSEAWGWYKKRLINWAGAYSGAIHPVKGSKIMVASIGGYFRTQLMRSDNEGKKWHLIDNLEENMNLFIAFHPNEPNIVYAGNKISIDCGKTFKNVDFGQYNSLQPSILGMCRKYPDTIYALDKERKYILRSDDKGTTWREYVHPGWKFVKLDSLPTFAVDPADKDKVYTIDKSGDLAVFNGKRWKSTGVLLMAGTKAGNFVRTVAIDPNHPEIIYAGMSRCGTSSVWRSMDSGKTWQDVTYNLPRTGAGAIAVNPLTGELFKGSAVGTWILQAPY